MTKAFIHTDWTISHQCTIIHENMSSSPDCSSIIETSYTQTKSPLFHLFTTISFPVSPILHGHFIVLIPITKLEQDKACMFGPVSTCFIILKVAPLSRLSRWGFISFISLVWHHLDLHQICRQNLAYKAKGCSIIVATITL